MILRNNALYLLSIIQLDSIRRFDILKVGSIPLILILLSIAKEDGYIMLESYYIYMYILPITKKKEGEAGKRKRKISHAEDRTPNLLGKHSFCEREIITIRPRDSASKVGLFNYIFKGFKQADQPFGPWGHSNGAR